MVQGAKLLLGRISLAVAITLAAVGCGGSSQRVQEPHETTAPSSQLDLPTAMPSSAPVGREWIEQLDLGVVPQLDARAYNEAQRRIGACMRSRGFDYEPIAYVDTDRDVGRLTNPLRADVVEVYGYHKPPVEGIVIPGAPDTPEYQAALGGTDGGQEGCGISAQRKVRESGADLFELYGSTLASLDEATFAFWSSPEAIPLSAAWSGCMAQSGYQYSSPIDPLRQYAGSPSIEQSEIRTRLADLQCDVQTAFTKSRSDWERTAFETWMEEHSLELQQLKELAGAYDSQLRELEDEVL